MQTKAYFPSAGLVVPIADHYVVAAHADLSLLADWHNTAFPVDYLRLHVFARASNGTRSYLNSRIICAVL